MSDDTGDAAAEAFEALRAEVAAIGRSVAQLAAGKVDGPDYAPTLGAISHNQMVAAQRLEVLAQSPNLSLTPAAIGKQVERVVADMRVGERQTLDGVRRELEAAAKMITGKLASARDRDDQTMWLWVSGAGGALAGMLVWLAITGPIARELPASWQLPERFAANTMGASMWEAGKRLMAAGDRNMWSSVIADEQMIADNMEMITACRKAAIKEGKAVRCMIKIRSG